MFSISLDETRDYGGILLVEFLTFRCGCLSTVWWHVAEYLGCLNISRWGELAKRANVNSAHVINLSNPSSPHLLRPLQLMRPCPSLGTLSAEALLNITTLSLTSSTVSRKIPRKERGRFICWDIFDPAPFLSCTKWFSVICYSEERWRG